MNHGYGRILHEIESEKMPLPWSRLNSTNIHGLNVDIPWISRALWTAMVSNMTRTFRRSCAQLIGGEETNGIELWRYLFFKNQGGAEQVQLVDKAAFHAFPKCENPEHIPQFLGLWEKLRRAHGQTLPEEHLKPMLLNFLPDATAADVRKNARVTTGVHPHLRTLSCTSKRICTDSLTNPSLHPT